MHSDSPANQDFHNRTPEVFASWIEEVLACGFSADMPFAAPPVHVCGGDMSTEDDDFRVDEIPAYLPCGQGEHLYLCLEKKGKSSLDILKVLQDTFHVKEAEIGCAGKKDAHAITSQWFSIRLANEALVKDLEQYPWLRIIKLSRHTNKLRMGHLTGNRFSAVIADTHITDGELQDLCAHFAAHGFINYFGKQRFGFDGSNVLRGIRILCGARANHQLRLLYINALQAAIFNLCAAKRYETLKFSVMQGDVLKKNGGGCFICSDPIEDEERSARGEVGTTIALPGKKVMHGSGQGEENEKIIRGEFQSFWRKRLNLPNIDMDRLTAFADGDRRLMRIIPAQLQAQRLDEKRIQFQFVLPPGAYATVLLRHLCGFSFTR